MGIKNGEYYGGYYMVKKIKIILAIGFFPVVIFCYLIKSIYRSIEKRRSLQFISNISIEEIDGLDGEEFEELLAMFFRGRGLKVTKTKKSHDYGADLLVTTKDEVIAIQCKLYYKRPVSNSAIQEIATAKDYYSASRAVVITNSKFTKPAEILADKIGVKLIDRDSLQELLSSKREYNLNL